MTNTINAHNEGGSSLLDFLLVIVQNLRLLVLGSLTCGLLALGVSYLLPSWYESVAIQSGDAQLLAIYNSAEVRDALIEKCSYSQIGEDKTMARHRLANDLRVTFDAKSQTLRIVASAASAGQAQKIVQAAIDVATDFNQSRIQELSWMQKQFEASVKRERYYFDVAERMSQRVDSALNKNSDVLLRSQAQIIDAALKAQLSAVTIAEKLRTSNNFGVIQPPSFPGEKSKPRQGLIAALATLFSVFVLLIFVFARQALLNLSQDLEGVAKLNEIKAAWRCVWGRVENSRIVI